MVSGAYSATEQAAVRRGQHGDAAHLAELERALGVGREEDLFDGDDLRLPELQQRGELDVDLEQADGCAVLLVQANGAGAQRAQLRDARGVVDLHHTVAGELRSAVDAEDPHADKSTALRWPLTTTAARDRHLTRKAARDNQQDSQSADSQPDGATDTIDATQQVNSARSFPKADDLS